MTKQMYLKTEHAKRFAALVGTLDFEVALDTAMLHFVFKNSDAPDHNRAIANAYKLEGAKAFLRILQTIAQTEQQEAAARWPEMVKT